MITHPINGMSVFVNDAACITYERKQYRFPRQKSHRRIKKWSKNPKNFRVEEVHKAFVVNNTIYMSTKSFKELETKYCTPISCELSQQTKDHLAMIDWTYTKMMGLNIMPSSFFNIQKS